MKKQIFVVLFSFINIAAFAQFGQGTKMLGGSFAFSSETRKDRSANTTRAIGTTTDFSLAPQFGYFVIERLAIGASLDLSLSKYKSKVNEEDISYTTIQLAPFVRYYLPSNFFFQGQFGVGTSKESGRDNDGFTIDRKSNVSSWSLAAGYAIMLTESVTIEPTLGYGSVYYKNPDGDPDFSRRYPGLFLRVGFQVYIP